MISKSLSQEYRNYVDFCYKASINTKTFNNFRRNNSYTKVLEHVSKYLGSLYLREIENNFPEYKNYLEKFKLNDLYGNPYIFKYGNFKISPSTLRYIKVYTDLVKSFGRLDDLKICEIGGGVWRAM